MTRRARSLCLLECADAAPTRGKLELVRVFSDTAQAEESAASWRACGRLVTAKAVTVRANGVTVELLLLVVRVVKP